MGRNRLLAVIPLWFGTTKSQQRSLLNENPPSYQLGGTLRGYRHIGNITFIMEKSEKFSDYLFTKMGPPTIGSGDATKTTDNCDAPVELTGFRRWLSKNYLLLMTLSGVLLGVIEGRTDFICSYLAFDICFHLISSGFKCKNINIPLYYCKSDISNHRKFVKAYISTGIYSSCVLTLDFLINNCKSHCHIPPTPIFSIQCFKLSLPTFACFWTYIMKVFRFVIVYAVISEASIAHRKSKNNQY